jgi:predicted anti-sigma-YlaC factor YlaD
MDCDTAREAISARIDGEDDGLADDALEAHLASCPACRGWEQRAHMVTRRARLGGAFLDHDLAPRVLAAAPAPHPGWQRRPIQRAALLAVALGQLAVAAPMLILGHDHDAGVHAAHELGSFNLALAVAFAIGALRPKLSSGLAWPCAVAALGLVATALADLCSGQAIGADEAMHLVAVAGAALLAWQARTVDATTAAPALPVTSGQDEPGQLAAPADFAGRRAARDGTGTEPSGGSAARGDHRDIAGQAAGPGADSAADGRNGARGESVA